MAVTTMRRALSRFAISGLALPALLFTAFGAIAQDRQTWERTQPAGQQRLGGDEDADRPDYQPRPAPAPYQGGGGYAQPRGNDAYSAPSAPGPQSQGGYAPPGGYAQPGGYAPQGGYGAPGTYRAQAPVPSDVYRPPSQSGGAYGQASGDMYRPPASGGYGQPYTPPPLQESDEEYDNGGNGSAPPPAYGEPRRYERPVSGYYSKNEIAEAGHGFFGSVSRGLASAIEYTFQKAGRPNGYILGEDAGGAFIAGLRYGEGRLHTKDAGTHKVFWQGPSIGYDFGGEGSKTMVLVYNLRDPSDIYNRFGGVEGSAYLVGGVSVQFQKYGDVVLAPIRSGIGLRLGANVGYLKYTRSATWNPF